MRRRSVYRDTERAAELLGRTAMFGDLLPGTMEKLSASTEFREFAEDDLVLWENSDGNQLFLIVEGSIGIERLDLDDRVTNVTVRGAGEIIGELALFAQRPRSADARALERTLVLVVDGQEVDDMLDEHPELARGIIKVLAEKVVQAMERGITERWSVERRLAAELIREAREGFEKVEGVGYLLKKSITQGQLAQRINCSRERVNRAMKSMRENRIAEMRGRQVVILDRERLKEMVGD